MSVEMKILELFMDKLQDSYGTIYNNEIDSFTINLNDDENQISGVNVNMNWKDKETFQYILLEELNKLLKKQ